MRIREQAKLAGIRISNAGFSSGDTLSSPIGTKCQLSKSPWDCFDSPLSSLQIGGEGDYTLDVSFWDSVESIKSFPTMQVSDNEDQSAFLNKCSKKAAFSGDESLKLLCAKTDGKSWKCRNEVAEGLALCQHHLDQLKGYNSTQTHVSVGMGTAGTRRKKRVMTSSLDPYYYYSGFGRHAGKQRGVRLDQTDPTLKVVVDYIEDDSDSDDVDEEVGKKRARKPIKERSLKSLM